jgi:hypothetical protein
MNLTTFKTESGIELVINTDTHEAYATQSGYSRMSGVALDAISKRLSRGYKGVDISNIQTAELHTAGGLQGVRLLPADVVFDWLLDDNRDLAKAMGACGANVYLHGLAGYQIQITKAPKTSADMLIMFAEQFKKQELEIEALKAIAVKQEESQSDNERRLDGIEAEVERFNYPMGRYYSVMGYGSLRGLKLTLKQASSLGIQATKICKGLDIAVEKVCDPRFGRVGCYPENVLAELFREIAL